MKGVPVPGQRSRKSYRSGRRAGKPSGVLSRGPPPVPMTRVTVDLSSGVNFAA